MKNSKLIKILKTFSKEEIKEFEKLINSPFFSTGRNLLPFFKAVKRFYPDFNDDRLTDEHIFKFLYPGKPYKKSTMGKLNADLMKLGLEYLKQLSFRNYPVYEKILLSNTCNERKLYSIAKKLILDSDSFLESQKFNRKYYARKEFITGAMQNFVFNTGKLENIIEYTGITNKLVVEKFIYLGMTGYINQIIYKNAYKSNIESEILVKFIDSLDLKYFVEKLELKNSPADKFLLINIYSILSWKHLDNDDYYFKLKNLTFQHFDLFELDLQNLMLIILKYLLTFKKTKFNFKDSENEIFEINKFSLKKGTYINAPLNCFPKKDFVTYFETGFELQEYEWSENFIKKYSKYLSENEKSDAVNYCKASLAFAYKNYDSCLDFLNLINVKDEFEKTFIYSMRSAVFYEKGLYEEVLYILDNYLKFINRESKIRQDRKQNHINFINAVKSLVNLKLKPDNLKKFDLEKSVENYKDIIVLKKWVMECLHKS